MRRVPAVLSYALAVCAVFVPLGAAAGAGDLDPTFGVAGALVTPVGVDGASVEALAVQADGKIVAIGQADYAAGATGFALARYLPSGPLDPSFGSGGIVMTPINAFAYAAAGAVDARGRIVAVGSTSASGTAVPAHWALARYRADGSLDPSFGDNGIAESFAAVGVDSAWPTALGIQPDGKLVVAGTLTVAGAPANVPEIVIARYTESGSLDPTFATGGVFVLDSPPGFYLNPPASVLLELDGGILVVTYPVTTNGVRIIKLDADGRLDPSFGAGGVMTDDASGFVLGGAVLAGDGSIVVPGTVETIASGMVVRSFTLRRYASDGTYDPSFGAPVGPLPYSASASAVLRQPDGKIVVGGAGGDRIDRRFVLVRFGADGRVDLSFGAGGVVVTGFAFAAPDVGRRAVIRDLALDATGNIVAGGYVNFGDVPSSTQDFALARYLGKPSVPPPPPDGGGGSGGGSGGGGSGGGSVGDGGGGGLPDLVVSVSADPATGLHVGDAVMVSFTLAAKPGSGLSQGTHLVISLPPGVSVAGLVPPDRGPGCSGSGPIDCDVDFLRGGQSTTARVAVRLEAGSDWLVEAQARQTQQDVDATDNLASLRLVAEPEEAADEPAGDEVVASTTLVVVVSSKPSVTASHVLLKLRSSKAASVRVRLLRASRQVAVWHTTVKAGASTLRLVRPKGWRLRAGDVLELRVTAGLSTVVKRVRLR